MIFLCWFIVHRNARFFYPVIFELWITICWVCYETIVNSFKFLFETCPSIITDYEMLFLYFSSVVPNFSRSHLLDNVVPDWESVQSSLMIMLIGFKMLIDFTFFQEMSTSGLWSENNSLGKLFVKVFVFDWWRWSRQSLARQGIRIFRFCVMLW